MFYHRLSYIMWTKLRVRTCQFTPYAPRNTYLGECLDSDAKTVHLKMCLPVCS